MDKQLERIAGIDLAWQSTNPSGVCIADLDRSRRSLHVISCRGGLTFENVLETLEETLPYGVAIDAPLIIPNETGNRACERAVTSTYGSRHAGCHTSNRQRYPDAISCQLAEVLARRGHRHAGDPASGPWQIECYPHPAIIEIFGLPRRLKYKKGSVDDKKAGQITLARLLQGLSESNVLGLELNEEAERACGSARIRQLRGQAIKDNEDLLDGLLCAYVAALYAIGASYRKFGDESVGYIVVPTVECLTAEDAPEPTSDRLSETKPAAKTKKPRTRVSTTSVASGGGSTFVDGSGKYNRIGAVNRNEQECLGSRGTPGTDHGQVVFRMHCQHCGKHYGVNGTSVFQCRCPYCQGGKSNLGW